MTFELDTIYWFEAASVPSFQGQVTCAVFLCNENRSDIVRAEVTCEDESCIYAFTLRPAELGYEGTCFTWSSATHSLKSEQPIKCTILNGTEGGALLLGSPLRAHDRENLHWLIRIKFVKREFKPT